MAFSSQLVIRVTQTWTVTNNAQAHSEPVPGAGFFGDTFQTHSKSLLLYLVKTRDSPGKVLETHL